MINGVSQAMCAFIPASDSTLPERRKRRRDLAPRAGNTGTYYPQTNYCGTNATEMYNLTLPAGTSHRLRLINSGTFLATRFSIDGHNLTVVEVDGTSVEPVTVSGVNLAVAQRCSVIVHLDQQVSQLEANAAVQADVKRASLARIIFEASSTCPKRRTVQSRSVALFYSPQSRLTES